MTPCRVHHAPWLRTGGFLIAAVVIVVCVGGGVAPALAHAEGSGCAPAAEGHAVCKAAAKSDSVPLAVLPAIGAPRLAEGIVPAAVLAPAAHVASRPASPLASRSPPAR